MKKKGFVVMVLAMVALFVSLGFAGSSPAAEKKEVIKLKIGSGHPTATDWIRFLSDFYCKEVVKRVNERTNYRLELSEHWAGSVAKLGEELEAIEMGLLDMGGLIIAFEPTKMFLQNWGYYIPFLPGDPRVMGRINNRLYKEFPALKNEYKKYNQVYLGSGGVGDYGLIAKFPVRSTADVKGRKIAAAGPNLPWISGVGAVPVQSNLPEAYTSLQTGVYEAWVMFATGIMGFKLYEPCKYFTDTNFGATPGLSAITINAKVWDKLPKEVKAILQEVADEYSVKEYEYLAEMHKKAMKVIQDAGTNIYQLPLEEKTKWAKTLVNQPKKFAKEADAKGWPGTALMKAAIKFAEEEGHIFARKWMEE
ncbi:MAG: C4-dicarboxylate ABC transporter substrate-binding protein [Deltaproteobacteria bacterium]|nr:C4-dicarboxylate ABC transporter substrate-binding protein [Deltaproteobacteria bacterium]